MKKILAVTGALAALALANPVQAAPFTISGSSGSKAASVTFNQVGGAGSNVTITLTNTTAADVLVPADVLTAVFFDSTGLTLTRVSAIVAGGSTVFFGTADAGGNVGKEWASNTGLDTGAHTYSQGISSTGLDLFGPGDRFDSSGSLQGPDSPDGLQYGITSAGDNTATGNQKVTGSEALIKNSVVFTFSVDAGFVLTQSAIGQIRFQYGTALDEGNITVTPSPQIPVPAPPALVMGLIGFAGIAGLRRLRRI